jgi:hypothetical protein
MPWQKDQPVSKTNKQERTGDLAQVVECLPGIHDYPGSIPSTARRKSNKINLKARK